MKLSYQYHWYNFTEEQYSGIIREFEDNGVSRFVFPYHLSLTILFEDPGKEDFLKQLTTEMGVEFSAMHGLYGIKYDLNIPDAEGHKNMVQSHIRAMELGKRFGCQTYTVHPGAFYHIHNHIPAQTLRENAIRVLEELLPEAERIGIIITLEDSFEESNSSDEVLAFIHPFLSSAAIGVCYDSGHANCMRGVPGKKNAEYPDYVRTAWWENGFFHENQLEKLQNHIVTCHLHDNNEYRDLHAMFGDGTIVWQDILTGLKQCPVCRNARRKSIRSETLIGLVHHRHLQGAIPSAD